MVVALNKHGFHLISAVSMRTTICWCAPERMGGNEHTGRFTCITGRFPDTDITSLFCYFYHQTMRLLRAGKRHGSKGKSLYNYMLRNLSLVHDCWYTVIIQESEVTSPMLSKIQTQSLNKVLCLMYHRTVCEREREQTDRYSDTSVIVHDFLISFISISLFS